MTSREYSALFQGKVLIVDNSWYHFDNKGNYLLAKGEDSISGTYRFKQQGDKVYLITKPPIYPDEGQEVEVTLYLGTHRVLFENK